MQSIQNAEISLCFFKIISSFVFKGDRGAFLHKKKNMISMIKQNNKCKLFYYTLYLTLIKTIIQMYL